ncbi:MAG: phosphoadenylyl-sulfate reductase [Myxococcales bacterium]|nr:phosphoadenylyl-sulfate reductase [Myxococcales bacterium]
MQITMVKKRLEGGAACGKCDQAEDLLKERGAWPRIDRVVWAHEDDPSSEGMRLAGEHGIDTAPFFLVEQEDGATVAYTSVLKLLRERLTAAPPSLRRDVDLDAKRIEELAMDLSSLTPQEVITWVLEHFGKDCGIAFSGAEDVALIDMAARSGHDFNVFCLDTGRLHAETYRFIDEVRKHYGLEIEMISPEPAPLRAFVRKKGLFSFYEDGHKECCGVRKVEPLKRVLGEHRAWATGQRRDQSPTRADVPVLQLDPAFSGRDGALVKTNPLAEWSSEQTWRYIRDNGVPFNPLHTRGFVSIGCEPCTRPINPSQHEREGRWWWEEATQKECGLHAKH